MRLIRKGRHEFQRRSRARWVALAAVAAFAALLIGAAGKSNATVPANFVSPNHVATDFEGCRNTGSITLPNGSGQFVCPDAAYTSGDLGKGWNELDLVPFYVEFSVGNQSDATTDFNLIVAGDYSDNGNIGWDVISAPSIHSGSDASCSVSANSQDIGPGITGGADSSIYRVWTVHLNKGASCRVDYYMRLALGSHNYSGSNLQAYIFGASDFSTGKSTIPLPVNEIAPQSLSKDMSATQDTDHTWSVTKKPTPADVSFGNTCDANNPTSAPVSIAVTWTKGAATPSGDVTVTTHVYATNPAARTITTAVTDVIYSGTTALDTSSSSTDVPANTTELVLTHTTAVPAGTTNLNDIATGTYTDTVTGVPIPGSTTATASATVQPSGVDLNSSAVINDTESITGSGLSYSTDSVSGASGTFDGGYVAGTPTTGSVSWTSASQSDSGSATFSKTVYVTPKVSTSGSLDDTATLTGSDGFTTSAQASVSLSAHPLVSLTINKTISAVAGTDQTFHFDVSGPTPSTGNALTIAAGHTSNSITLTGLEPGKYSVHEETPPSPWVAPSDQSVDLSLPSCSGSVSFANTFAPATAQVAKVTNPAGSEAGWTFTMKGSDGSTESVTTTGTGYQPFTTQLVDGVTYTITETAQAGWDLTNVAGDTATSGGSTVSTNTSSCSFTPHYFTNPADAGNVFECTFTNTERGTIIVKKVTNPSGAPGSFTFTGDAAGSIGDGGTITVSNLKPGTYTSTEANPTPAFDLTDISCDDASSATPSTGSLATRTATFKLDPGETVTCTFTNTQRGHAKVVKTVNGAAPTGSQSFTFQLRTGASASSAGTILETGTANAADGGVISFATYLVPGQTYQLCEQMQAGWMTSLGPPLYSVYNPSGDNSVVCTDFTVTAGQTLTFNIDNKPPPGGMALTIGYWKNWSSCSGGKQTPTLDKTLLAAANAGHPITIGTLVLNPNTLGAATACKYAVNLLNKTTINGRTKEASDPLFNMAAQLLAAELNVQAGAGSCAASTSAITQAQQLLVKYSFNGTAPPYTPKLTSADATLANSLATSLDKYNNNLLC